ncbi:MAG: DNA-directed RNA polymerase subunit delta [Bacilli bacterium]|jgi:DNA-directed RNA polymerase delta subunit
MSINNNESLLEIAVRLMKSKKKPKSLKELTNEVFREKGIVEDSLIDEKKAQFQVDFMVSGYFVCCGENRKGHKLWDLKSRQPSSLIDKDGNLLEDLYADDEDVIKNELKDEDDLFDEEGHLIDDEDEDNEEHDDIEEELSLVSDSTEDTVTEEVVSSLLHDDEDEDNDEVDDIEEELKK